MSIEVVPRYKKAEVVTSGAPFNMRHADALYIATAVTFGLTVFLTLDNVQLNIDSAPAGTILPLACFQVFFGDGQVVAMRA